MAGNRIGAVRDAFSRVYRGRGAAVFSIFGVTIRIDSNNKVLLQRTIESLASFFPMPLRACKPNKEAALFRVVKEGNGYRFFSPHGNSGSIPTEDSVIKQVRTHVRISVAANAPNHVFLHAGALDLGGKALILPADSRSGKTTLVRALLDAGASYLSDEYAVLNRNGEVVPFPKPLSVRGIEGPDVQTDVHASDIGAEITREPVPVGWVLLSRYRNRGRWNPIRMSPLEGRLQVIPHAIGMVNRPDFTLKILEKAFKNAVFLKSDRGEASGVATKIIQTLDK